ncbi:hypothetical protein CORC01_01899 [Colletotrichum orchidophilum]|uniref:Uncharacterized protein n=1 Tax=Colletotrichum orchidophilum TaxID=1209926 RepID=A0A1G4BNB3_9PEZI|nr:uncharacterized protein CORC01_01899 [Colletotrichum orchidophilum]OHF02798.1 hypothetical protein CORC01_01899 [Colletotrichum orchidophilum]
MKFTTSLLAIGIVGAQSMEPISENPARKYGKPSIAACHNCNDANGASDSYKDFDCDMPCARAGMNEGASKISRTNYAHGLSEQE